MGLSGKITAQGSAVRFPGWTVWAAREGNARVATRAGNPKFIDDGLFAATLICDDWTQLETELAVQAQRDAERACP
jgi:hypothetical protein